MFFDWLERGINLLSELSVDGEHLRVADKGECQDWDGVCCLKDKIIEAGGHHQLLSVQHLMPVFFVQKNTDIDLWPSNSGTEGQI